MENKKYLDEQLITYLGNKRTLLDFINESVDEIKKKIGLDKIITFDGFAGSGVVSRMLKQHSSMLYANDLEKYSHLVTDAYLTNSCDVDFEELGIIIDILNNQKLTTQFGIGIIEKLYSPVDTNNIKLGERCFYTNENAKIIDNIRRLIDTDLVPVKYRNLCMAMLLHKASVHTNTSGVFKGFYKLKKQDLGAWGGEGGNALSRIMGEISLSPNILSNYNCNFEVFNDDVINVVNKIGRVHLAYYDPPYNQHPYSSNYHILNTILEYIEPKDISKVSGIRTDWNKSNYNYKQKAEQSMIELIDNTDAEYIFVSYNNEGIISKDSMHSLLSRFGDVDLRQKDYNTFRGSRNLKERSNKVVEMLYILKKN